MELKLLASDSLTRYAIYSVIRNKQLKKMISHLNGSRKNVHY